ncbi:hypothetical protein ASF22_02520 [Methylobacterium sp. Leaf87]|uniref:hypothetical protein n=1 Tax=Methylobacterium sp. Leaf87 TaxID=1736243 RepID=UPI0006F56C00|nr:hypothetical protein [Methylobacterium sp. Leaf87]KQO69502.1 hypothetical protein ASF22_02520 [Methylobacterium sp. Leaf87]
MAEESLLTAARRIVRFIRIDDAHGGLLSTETVQAADTLDKQVRRAAAQTDAPTPALNEEI